MSNLFEPGAYQGFGKTRSYFEGWYFKSVDKEEKTAYAVIPGISLSKDGSGSYSFIMFLDARGRRMRFFKYPLSAFSPDRKKFRFAIGDSAFSRDGLRLDVRDDEGRVTSDLKFSGVEGWPVTLFSPGVMGWYAFVPRMECKHAVLSLGHDIEGAFEVDGAPIDFTGGKGYIEKDWGASMPSSWVWMQTNHFDEDGVSLTGSVAKIPWLGRSFAGHIFGLLLGGRLYRFATYTGSRVTRLEADERSVSLRLEDKRRSLEIEAVRAQGVDLLAPVVGEMTGKVNESLSSVIGVRLYENGRQIFSGEGRNAGLEVKGDMIELIKDFKKL